MYSKDLVQERQSVTHDVCSMLAKLRLTVDALEGHKDPDVRRAMQRINRVVEEMAAYCAGSIEPPAADRKASFDHLLTRVADVLRPWAQTNGIRIITPTNGLWYQAERQAPLYRVLMNLARHSMNVMVEDGGACLTLRAAAHQDGVVIDVIDDGPGLPSDIAAAFETNDWPEAENDGLDLKSTKTLVEQLGGALTVLQTSDDGATVRVRLPQLGAAGETEALIGRAADDVGV
ncbi:MAG: HAMP domain-containing sensor histidine kinase [Pseudomonadota bacterium]